MCGVFVAPYILPTAPVGSSSTAVGRGLALGGQLVGLGRRHVALLARRRGDDREPDDALAGRLLLERLHVAALVVLPHVRAVVVRPLEHDDLAAVVARLTCLPVVAPAVKRGARRSPTLAAAAAPGGRGERGRRGAGGEGGETGAGQERATGQSGHDGAPFIGSSSDQILLDGLDDRVLAQDLRQHDRGASARWRRRRRVEEVERTPLRPKASEHLRDLRVAAGPVGL